MPPILSDSSADASAGPTCSVVVLTQGGRETELAALIGSFDLPANAEGLLVNNGGSGQPIDGWRFVESPTNLGVPGGRNFGAHHANGQIVVFIDDDAVSTRRDVISLIEQRFDDEPTLGAIGFRIVKPGTGESQQRWSPHVFHGDTTRTADVTTFVGGGHAIRKDLFDSIDGYYAPLFYGLEETDLSWRLLDAGWRVSFDADLMFEHPDIGQERHADVLWRTARNRAWIARRRLPLPLIPLYCGIWLVLQSARAGSLANAAQVLRGTWAGFTSSAGVRAPMRWSTVKTMARLGRPPII